MQTVISFICGQFVTPVFFFVVVARYSFTLYLNKITRQIVDARANIYYMLNKPHFYLRWASLNEIRGTANTNIKAMVLTCGYQTVALHVYRAVCIKYNAHCICTRTLCKLSSCSIVNNVHLELLLHFVGWILIYLLFYM